MNCHSKGHHGQMGHGINNDNSCCCMGDQNFLSKKKKIEVLNKHLTGLKEKVQDIEDYISELKANK